MRLILIILSALLSEAVLAANFWADYQNELLWSSGSEGGGYTGRWASVEIWVPTVIIAGLIYWNARGRIKKLGTVVLFAPLFGYWIDEGHVGVALFMAIFLLFIVISRD